MTDILPPCPKCTSAYTYLDNPMFICPECGNEWQAGEDTQTEDTLIIKDAFGNILQDGDSITLIKDLKLKGSSSAIKMGTKAKINRLSDGDHNLDCKVDGFGQIMLKSEFVKKA